MCADTVYQANNDFVTWQSKRYFLSSVFVAKPEQFLVVECNSCNIRKQKIAIS